jgi:hypothetical protein
MIPPEVTDEIIDHLFADARALRACALVSRTWVDTARMHLFEEVSISSDKAWRNLSDLLTKAPHVASHVHRLVISNRRGFLQYSVRDEAGPDRRTCLGRQLSGVKELHLQAINFLSPVNEVNRFFEAHFLDVTSLRMHAVAAPTSAALQQCCLAYRRNLRSVNLQHVTVQDVDTEMPLVLQLAGYDTLTLDRYLLRIPSDLTTSIPLDEEKAPPSSVRHLHARTIQPGDLFALSTCIEHLATSLESLSLHAIGSILSLGIGELGVTFTHAKFDCIAVSPPFCRSARRLRELSWREILFELAAVATTMRLFLDGCPSHELETIRLRFMVPTELLISTPEQATALQAWTQLGEKMQDPKFGNLKRFELVFSRPLFLFVEDAPADAGNADAAWFQSALTPLHASGVLIVSFDG